MPLWAKNIHALLFQYEIKPWRQKDPKQISFTGSLQAYRLGAYSLGAYRLGAYNLGVYSLRPIPILSLGVNSLSWGLQSGGLQSRGLQSGGLQSLAHTDFGPRGPLAELGPTTVWVPTVWGPTSGGLQRFATDFGSR